MNEEFECNECEDVGIVTWAEGPFEKSDYCDCEGGRQRKLRDEDMVIDQFELEEMYSYDEIWP